MTHKETIRQFYRDNVFPPSRKVQYAQYVASYGYVSEKYFLKIAKKSSKTVSLKTGGANLRMNDVFDCLTDRAIYGLNTENTISIDEKVFVPKKYSTTTSTVGIEHVGFVPAYSVQLGDKQYFTLQMAITSNEILYYNMIESSATSETFNQFICKVVDCIPDDGNRRFIILDNGKFHKTSSITDQLLRDKHLALCFNPPLACFLNPIEEVFSFVSSQVNQDITLKSMQREFSFSTSQLAEMVNNVLVKFPSFNFPFEEVYKRSCILPPSK